MTAERVAIPMGAAAVQRAPVLITALGLGSCVAVVLHDPVAGVAGLAHVVLPTPPPGAAQARPNRYAQTAVPLLLEAMEAAGADRARVSAKLVGGASMFRDLTAPGMIPLGERNTHAARAALRAASIPVSGEWVGGDFGRSITVDPGSGEVEVTSVRHGRRVL
jgi:chemotaxis protein CheD